MEVIATVQLCVVSIHAPREGCDSVLLSVRRRALGFNSRTPGGVRRTTTDNDHEQIGFNSRTPGGVRQ